MQIAKTIEEIRKMVKAARAEGKTVALVPTMGALHAGHISLIEAARKKCSFVVVSIFVNPTQFAPDEDFEKYPRPIQIDLQKCEQAKVDVVFNPSADQIYPQKDIKWVEVKELTDKLCGAARQGHFRGVTTICSKLFNIVTPDIAFFGQKDAQQAIVIKKMVADLNLPLQIEICPTIREPDGLAISSRNQYLTEKERADAVLIYRSLEKCRELIESGDKDPQTIIDQMRTLLQRSALIEIEYVSLVDAETLEDKKQLTGRVLVAIAARVGKARLIDNIILDANAK